MPAVIAIHSASASPANAANRKRGSASDSSSAMTTAASAGDHSRRPSRARLSVFQRISIPTPISSTSGAVNAMNIRLKYGGPTEILPPSASIAIG